MYSTEFQIGDTVRLIDDGNTYLVVAIQIQTYIGFNGRVRTNYILYLGNGLWRSAKACEIVSKRKTVNGGNR